MARRGLRRLPPFKDYLFRAAVLLSITSVALAFSIVTYRPPTPNHRQGEQIETNHENIDSKTFGERLLDDPTAFFTMVLAGLTFVLAGVSSLQIYFLLSADRTTRLAARSAVKSAEVAARTVRSIEETAERQLRAYIGVERAYISQSAISGTLKVTIVVKNSGQTPAYKHFSNINMGAAPESAKSIPINLPSTQVAHQATLMPNATFEVILNKVIDTAELKAAAQTNSLRVVIVGSVAYEDVFGKRELQVSKCSRETRQ